MNIIQKPCPNKRSPRSKPITHIVLHIMDGTLVGTDAWFAMDREARIKAGGSGALSSAHYGIGKSGEIHQYVPDNEEAWHAGLVDHPSVELPPGNPNSYSIGIEHEGKGTDELPLEMYVSSARLLRQLSLKYNIPLDPLHVVLHREIYSRKTCPGKLDRGLLLTLAKHSEPA